MEDEGVLFEGLRLGSAQAFEELLRADGPAMRRLALLYVPEDQVPALVAQTWAVALPGLDMFTWHTTLRAWLTGILVTYGRAWRGVPGTGDAPPPPRVAASPVAAGSLAAGSLAASPVGTGTAGTAGSPGTVAGDPLPWASLGWSSLWSPDSWGVLEDALAARPLQEREVLWLHDVEGWSWREVLDTLGLTGEQGADLLLRGRSALAATVAAHVGADPAGTVPAGGDGAQERLDGVARLLAALRPTADVTTVDPRLLRSFATWRRARGVRAWRRWRWELGRARPAGRTARSTAQPSSSVPTV